MRDGKTGVMVDIKKKHVYYGSGNSWKRFFVDGNYKTTLNLDLTELLADENLYKADLNKDGDTGDTISQVISNSGPKGFYKIASGAYVIDDSGLSPGSPAQINHTKT